ncbi:MAG: hypothetical protein LBD71_06275 [Treponema sp.]|nr:hypothetical protein [Treponema sp.]
MKFKSIFIIFNIFTVFFLLIIVFLPLFILDADFAGGFWRSAWPLGAVLVLALAVLDIFYALNSKLYRLLEREDWPALADYLESKVIRKGRYSPRLVRLLANTYLVMSDSGAVMSLENKTALARPSLIEKNALIFGAARILGGDTAGAAAFFSVRLDKGALKGGDALWVRWYYGFSLLLSRQFNKAAALFKVLVFESSDALIAGLSAYFLSDTLRKNAEDPLDCKEAAEEGRKRIRESLKTAAGWRKEISRIETEIHAAILRKYLIEAGNWLFEAG